MIMRKKNSGKVLIVAFDGLDYDLIKKYNCKNIMQDEFGKIDNDTGIKRRVTEELFTSFITGSLSDGHGVEGHKIWNKPKVEQFEKLIKKLRLINRFKKVRTAFYIFIGAELIKPKRDVIWKNTLFDKIPNSKALDVPGYNPSPLLQKETYFAPLKMYDSIQEVERLTNCEFNCQRNELIGKIDEDYDLLMAHFQKPDIYQHLFVERDERKIRKLYEEMDNFAKEVVKKSKDKFDVILFMSDHGIEEGKEHNKNAFYSSNIELGLKFPHITEFYSIIINFIGRKVKSNKKKNQKIKTTKKDKEKIKKRLEDLGYLE